VLICCRNEKSMLKQIFAWIPSVHFTAFPKCNPSETLVFPACKVGPWRHRHIVWLRTKARATPIHLIVSSDNLQVTDNNVITWQKEQKHCRVTNTPFSTHCVRAKNVSHPIIHTVLIQFFVNFFLCAERDQRDHTHKRAVTHTENASNVCAETCVYKEGTMVCSLNFWCTKESWFLRSARGRQRGCLSARADVWFEMGLKLPHRIVIVLGNASAMLDHLMERHTIL
jgi:hypothetical protein